MPDIFNRVFGEEIIVSNKKRKIIVNSDLDQSASGLNTGLMVILLVIGLGMLIVRLFYLTIIEGAKYRQAAKIGRAHV